MLYQLFIIISLCARITSMGYIPKLGAGVGAFVVNVGVAVLVY